MYKLRIVFTVMLQLHFLLAHECSNKLLLVKEIQSFILNTLSVSGAEYPTCKQEVH